MKISVVTATYNREKLLPKLYNSLKENYKTYPYFEWIIIDDGSIDNTKDLINKWINEAKFTIKYYHQKNQGKMQAINNVMKHVSGDITIEVDSDDYFTDNALKMINEDYESLTDENIYGILYKRKLIGANNKVDKSLNNQIIKLFDLHNKYGYDFDMNLTFKTSIRKKYIYELENNEKFITEARLYYKLDQLYDGLLFKDKEIIVGEYLNDGYSKNINKIFKNNPYGYYEYFKECLTYLHSGISFKKRLYFYKHYILFSYLTNKTKIECIKNVKGLNKIWITLLVIPGYIKSKKF